MSNELTGTVTSPTSGGTVPQPGVAVSNGRVVVRTDATGAFTLPAQGAERFVFLTVPSGMRATSGWYHDRAAQAGPYDFILEPAPERAAQPFTFAHITDLHVSARGFAVERPRQDQVRIPQPDGTFLDTAVTHPDELAADLQAVYRITPVDLIVTTGDLSNSGHPAEFAAYQRAIAHAPVPVISMPGNHDYMQKDAVAGHYRDALGPSYFSFEWGGVHFVAWDWDGWLRWGDGYAQHEWIAQDLDAVLPGTPVILLTHDHMPQEFYDRFPETHFIASFSGHWHTSRVIHDGRMPHYNTQCLCMGAIDYVPRGYRYVRVADNAVTVETHGLTDDDTHRGLTFRPLTTTTTRGENAVSVALGEPWATFQGDVRRSGCAKASVSVPLALAWRVPVGGALHMASPLIADGKVIVATQQEDVPGGSVVALDAATGDRVWNVPVSNSIKHTPAVADGRVVGVTVSGELFALDLDTGEVGWTAQIGDRQRGWMYRPVLVVDGTVYAGDNRTFGAFDVHTGAVRWTVDDLAAASEDDSWPSTSAPVWTGDAVLLGNLHEKVHLFAFDPATGARRWQEGNHEHASIVSGPAIAEDGTMIVQRLFAQVHALGPRAEIHWNALTDSLFSPAAPAVNHESVFAATGAGTVLCLDRATGDVKWSWRCAPAVASMASYVRGGYSLISSPVVAGDAVLVGGGDGTFRVLHAADGRVAWETNLGAPINSGAAVSGNAVVVGITDGTVACFTPRR